MAVAGSRAGRNSRRTGELEAAHCATSEPVQRLSLVLPLQSGSCRRAAPLAHAAVAPGSIGRGTLHGHPFRQRPPPGSGLHPAIALAFFIVSEAKDLCISPKIHGCFASLSMTVGELRSPKWHNDS